MPPPDRSNRHAFLGEPVFLNRLWGGRQRASWDAPLTTPTPKGTPFPSRIRQACGLGQPRSREALTPEPLSRSWSWQTRDLRDQGLPVETSVWNSLPPSCQCRPAQARS